MTKRDISLEFGQPTTSRWGCCQVRIRAQACWFLQFQAFNFFIFDDKLITKLRSIKSIIKLMYSLA